MKTNILSIALAFSTLTALAQKDEIKNAGDAVEDGNFTQAQAEIQKAEPKLSEANNRWTERFYLYKGQAYWQNGQATNVDDIITAAKAFEQAAEMGNTDASETLVRLKDELINKAVADQNSQEFGKSAEKLYAAYNISPQDTIYLYYAANSAVQGQDYEVAIDYLNQLKAMDYDGSGVEYYAVNTESGEKERMGSKEQMDLMVKTGQYENPEETKVPSKKGEIAGLIARIYIAEEDYEKAIAAMDDAKATNPDDASLLQAEADMYYRMGEKDKYQELMNELAEKYPDDASIQYNLGVTSAELGDNEKAVEYYKRALEIDPEMNQARMNIIAAILAKERALIDEMNNLGMSKEDSKRYEELEEERKEVYKESLPYLEAAIKAEPNNLDAIRTARNIYTQLDMEDKAEEMNAKLENQ
ncbi:tetratricopeptide repeat protein [Salegentibacter sp. HM20]